MKVKYIPAFDYIDTNNGLFAVRSNLGGCIHTSGQFNERLLLWQLSGIFLCSTVIFLFVLCCGGE